MLVAVDRHRDLAVFTVALVVACVLVAWALLRPHGASCRVWEASSVTASMDASGRITATPAHTTRGCDR